MRARFRRFAEEEAAGSSPLYARLARSVADDEWSASFVARLLDTQPNLLFAAVQYLTGPSDMPRDGRALRALLARRGDDVAALARTRRVQTNEVARCAVLLPALPPGPLAMLEVGASAGLCLLLDRYAYRYGRVALGDAATGVRLRCRAAGAVPVPATIPRVAWRRGVDLAPVDLGDPDAVRWLDACVWVDQHERRARLWAAIATARSDPPSVERGDLVEEVERLVAEAPPDAELVVFHGGVLAYLTPVRRKAFARALARASLRRPVTWLSLEAPGVVLAWPGALPRSRRLRFLLARTRFEAGGGATELLALAHPHGSSLAWCPPGVVSAVRAFDGDASTHRH